MKKVFIVAAALLFMRTAASAQVYTQPQTPMNNNNTYSDSSATHTTQTNRTKTTQTTRKTANKQQQSTMPGAYRTDTGMNRTKVR